MAPLAELTAAWGLEALPRPGRIALLAGDAQRILSDLLPLVLEQRTSTKDEHLFHKSSAARVLSSLCASLVAALDGSAQAEEAVAAEVFPVSKRAKRPRDGWSALCGLFPGCEEHVLAFSSAQDLGRLDQVCRHFHGPVGLSPVRSAALRAARSRHPNVPLGGALVQRSWGAVLRFAARVDERARGWTAAELGVHLDRAILAHRRLPPQDENIHLGRELGAAESQREGLASITAAILRDDWDDDANAVMCRRASLLLSNLSFGRRKNGVALGLSGSAFALIRCIRDGDEEARKNAAGALGNLAENTENQVSIVAAGALPPLVDLLRDGVAGVRKSAAGALRNLTFVECASSRECVALALGAAKEADAETLHRRITAIVDA